MNCGLKIEEGELPANYTNMHEKRIKAVLLFRYPAIQPSSFVFGLRDELVFLSSRPSGEISLECRGMG